MRPGAALLWQVVAAGWLSCATAPPSPGAPDRGLELALSPASLGAELHLAQRILLLRDGERRSFDAQLEVDAEEVRIAAFAMGRTVARLSWDGRRLEETHSRGAPAVVTPRRILSDVQLAFWPAEAIRPALPPGFALVEGPGERTVTRDGAPLVAVRSSGSPAAGRVELTHLAYGYRLVIESREVP